MEFNKLTSPAASKATPKGFLAPFPAAILWPTPFQNLPACNKNNDSLIKNQRHFFHSRQLHGPTGGHGGFDFRKLS